MLLACASNALPAQDFFDDEPPEFLPGLIGTLRSEGVRVVRVDQDLQFDWGAAAVDPRLEHGQPFSAEWRGLLQVKERGEFVLSAFVAGEISVQLDGQEVIHARTSTPRWIHGKPLQLRFGRYDFRVLFTSHRPAPRLGMFWKGPSFGLEPITPRHYSHATDESPDTTFEQGQLLSRGLRCAACHEFDGLTADTSPLLAAPALTHLRDNLQPAWLVNHLQEQAREVETEFGARRMPYFGLDENDARAITTALVDASETSPEPEPIKPLLQELRKKRRKKDPPVRIEADGEIGATTFVSAGCLACHQFGELGTATNLSEQMFGGGDLSFIGDKRTEQFFHLWLADPASVNKNHRMPIFEVSLNERQDLVAFLSKATEARVVQSEIEPGDAQRGKELISRLRCAACHQLPASLKEDVKRTHIDDSSNWDAGCLLLADPISGRPGYGLDQQQRGALRDYFVRAQQNQTSGRHLLAENNCLACHSRFLEAGIDKHLPEVAATYPETAARLAAMSPPSLTGVGDKLNDESLADAITRKSPALRPWLDVRMPKFQFDPAKLNELSAFLVAHDRIPDGVPLSPDVDDEFLGSRSASLAAARLVTAEGFGCQSCHQIGDFEAPKVDLKARGTNLAMLGQRLRKGWFHRWVRNPARIVARMEMPAVQTAARGVLADDLDLQLEALWRVLNEPDFRPPRPNPVRVVRNHNQPDAEEQAHLVTCVIETPGRNFVRPLAVGLANRHNLLFDLESASLAGFWIGDTASQYTRGKTWYWEAGSQFLNLPSADNANSQSASVMEQIAVVDDAGGIWHPSLAGQVSVILDEVRHIADGLEWEGRLNLGKDGVSRQIYMRQRITAEPDNHSLVDTTLHLEPSEKVRLLTDGRAGEVASHGDGSQRLQLDFSDELSASLTSSQLQLDGSDIVIAGISNEAGKRVASWTTTFQPKLPADAFPLIEMGPIAQPVKLLDCVPGYETLQLPLPRDEMPIGFAWGPQGELFMGSLKGNVLRLHDDDGDGLEDRYETISDDYPTPYGLQVTKDGAVDALTKFALVRFSEPEDGNGTWDASVVADGWGYTADYHDWAIGIVTDPDDNYIIALPCQQDERPEAAAHLRGHALKLIANEDSADTHREFRIESFAAGLRFPMGLAITDTGELFATDNQGNYNPFNELNHVQSGKRYGFINKLENKDGFSPPFESPAINLPHPWSRSVNGICWLRTPKEVLQSSGSTLFGPFEGHLIGCEMNGRSLVRMTLQKVGDSYQGAAYVFSKPGLDPSETFEGPIVCDIAPNGDLYVGNLHDSGWGAGQNTGSITRLRQNGTLPTGIAEVRATARGFEVSFTGAVDEDLARDPASYQVRSYRRVSTPAYGGDDQDEAIEQVTDAQLSEDAGLVRLSIDELRQDAVYEITIQDIGLDGGELFPNQAHYTMKRIPADE